MSTVSYADRMMHILRNPHGWSDNQIRDARLWAGNRIEELERDNARLLATNHLEIVLPPFGHSFTLPTERLDMEALKWMQDNCVIVTRKEWERLRAADQPAACLATTVNGGPLTRCDQYPDCPCGGPENNSAACPTCDGTGKIEQWSGRGPEGPPIDCPTCSGAADEVK